LGGTYAPYKRKEGKLLSSGKGISFTSRREMKNCGGRQVTMGASVTIRKCGLYISIVEFTKNNNS